MGVESVYAFCLSQVHDDNGLSHHESVWLPRVICPISFLIFIYGSTIYLVEYLEYGFCSFLLFSSLLSSREMWTCDSSPKGWEGRRIWFRKSIDRSTI